MISKIIRPSNKLQNREEIKRKDEDTPLHVDETNHHKEHLENVHVDVSLIETEKIQQNIEDIKIVPEVEIVKLSKIGNKLNQYFSSQQNDFSDPVYIVEQNNAIIINDRHKIFRKRIKKDREILEEILVLYKIAQNYSDGDPKKLERLFFKNLTEWRR